MVYACVCVCVRACIWICASCVHTHMYYIHTYMHTYMHAHTYMYTNIKPKGIIKSDNTYLMLPDWNNWIHQSWLHFHPGNQFYIQVLFMHITHLKYYWHLQEGSTRSFNSPFAGPHIVSYANFSDPFRSASVVRQGNKRRCYWSLARVLTLLRSLICTLMLAMCQVHMTHETYWKVTLQSWWRSLSKLKQWHGRCSEQWQTSLCYNADTNHNPRTNPSLTLITNRKPFHGKARPTTAMINTKLFVKCNQVNMQ